MMGGAHLTHQSLAGGGVVTTVDGIAAAVDALLTLQETGGTLTADGTEQTIYIENAPAGVFKPIVMWVDLDNMLAGDEIALRVYVRIAPGGALKQWDYQTFAGINGGLVDANVVTNISLLPVRYGIEITLEQTAGTNRAFDWGLIMEV